MPRDRTRKSTLVAVKVDAELAALLDAMPNKSEFIRMALRARLDDLCPLCAGTGLRPSQPLEHRSGRHLHALPARPLRRLRTRVPRRRRHRRRPGGPYAACCGR